MMKITAVPITMLLILFLFAVGCLGPIPVFDEMTDTRDNQTYDTVTLGTQTWLAQNLNYETGNSWCYDDDSENCGTYGRLYDWDTATTACPTGWHLASDAEWSTLVKYLDPLADPSDEFNTSEIAGGMLKTTGTVQDGTGLWNQPNTGATNASGFSALPSGTRSSSGNYQMLGYHVMFWTATEFDDDNVWTMMLDISQSATCRDNEAITKEYAVSVRCVMDDM